MSMLPLRWRKTAFPPERPEPTPQFSCADIDWVSMRLMEALYSILRE
jgi:hypothetical protein